MSYAGRLKPAKRRWLSAALPYLVFLAVFAGSAFGLLYWFTAPKNQYRLEVPKLGGEVHCILQDAGEKIVVICWREGE